MNCTPNPKNSDEIDIFELMVSIWKGRWFIVSFILLSLLLSSAYIYISSGRFNAEIEIKPIPEYEFINYNAFNRIDIAPITRELLLRRFIERINHAPSSDGKGVKYEKPRGENQAEPVQFASYISRNIKIQARSVKNKEGVDKIYLLKYSGSNRDQFQKGVEYILKTANTAVFNDINGQLERQIGILVADRAEALKSLENNIESLKVLYEESIKSRLAFLKEQALIARSLGIEHNSLTGPSAPISSDSLTAVERDITVYLRGYKAIDKEIELILSRSNTEPFIPGIPEIRMKMHELQRDDSVERLKEAIEQSPLGQLSGFRAAMYDLNTLKISPVVRAPLVIALALILGAMLGVIALGIRNTLAGRTQS